MKKDIYIILPFKESLNPNYAGAVSLFVKDTIIHSRFKKSTFVFGNMDYKKPFLKNYINGIIKKLQFFVMDGMMVIQGLKINMI